MNRQSAPMKRGWTKRLLHVAAREQAVAEVMAKVERLQTDAHRARDDLRRKIDYLQTKVQEIAA